MPNRPTRPSQRIESTRSTESRVIDRRRLLQGSGVAALVAIAGCLDSLDASGDGDDDGDDDSEGDDESPGDPVVVVDAYLEAAVDEDFEAMSELSHELNPLDPQQWVEAGWEFQGGDEGEDRDGVPEYETDVHTEDGTVDDVYDLESAEFWFQDVDLEAELEGESIAVVDVVAETDGLEERSRWILATEDDEWELLIQGEVDETPDDPTEAFDEELIDEDDDVVVEIDWEYERPDFGDDDDDDDDAFEVTQAAVVLTDSPGLEAHTVRAESVIAGGSNEFYHPDDEPGGWAGSRIFVQYDPDGDQIEVTAIGDDEETVVHREHYEP